jgi:hypothetical protein
MSLKEYPFRTETKIGMRFKTLFPISFLNTKDTKFFTKE